MPARTPTRSAGGAGGNRGCRARPATRACRAARDLGDARRRRRARRARAPDLARRARDRRGGVAPRLARGARARRVPATRGGRGADPPAPARRGAVPRGRLPRRDRGRHRRLRGGCLARRGRDHVLAAADVARLRARGTRPPSAAGTGDARDPAGGRCAARAARGRRGARDADRRGARGRARDDVRRLPRDGAAADRLRRRNEGSGRCAEPRPRRRRRRAGRRARAGVAGLPHRGQPRRSLARARPRRRLGARPQRGRSTSGRFPRR